MTTPKNVTFLIDDVELLYSIPEPGGDVATILRCFVFLNRSAAPVFTTFRRCVTKGLQTGILVENDGHYRVERNWYRRIHANDESAENEINSMLEFQDTFLCEEVPIKNDLQLNINEREYQEIAGHVS